MRLGYFGGSFDPPHLGHLAVARAAADAFALDRVLFVPTAHQPLKPTGATASYADRLAMVSLLCADDPRLAASDLEAPLPDHAPNYSAPRSRQPTRSSSSPAPTPSSTSDVGATPIISSNSRSGSYSAAPVSVSTTWPHSNSPSTSALAFTFLAPLPNPPALLASASSSAHSPPPIPNSSPCSAPRSSATSLPTTSTPPNSAFLSDLSANLCHLCVQGLCFSPTTTSTL